MKKIKKSMMFMWPFVWAAFLLLWGCFDGMESSGGESNVMDDQYSPLIVKKAKALVESRPDFCLPDTHKPVGTSSKSTHKKGSEAMDDIKVDWDDYRLVVDGNRQMALFPIKGKGQPTAFTALTMGGQTHKRMNMVTNKLLVRQNDDKSLTGVVLTYIYDQNYYNEFGKELDALAYEFTKTHFTGFFITSRLDGTILLGRRIENGKEVFSFRYRSSLPGKASNVEDSCSHDVHLFLWLNPGTVVKRVSLLDFEYDTTEKCSLCGKPIEDCTCVDIVACSKCGEKIVDGKCGCNKDETEGSGQTGPTCPTCHSVIGNDGRCACCQICRMYPCRCGGASGGSGGGNNGGSSGGSGGTTRPPGGGSTGGGNNTGGTQAARPGTTAVKNAAKNAVSTINRLYGTKDSYCNYGVQQAFKNIFGSSNLPPGMKGKANEMARAWRNNPKYWQPISLSQAQDYANKGYFVVAGYINPNPNKSGHVVVIMPGTAVYSSKWGCNVPMTMDTGYKKRWDYKFLSNSFGPDKKNNITYYFYKR